LTGGGRRLGVVDHQELAVGVGELELPAGELGQAY
jgi:hypothetical protein